GVVNGLYVFTAQTAQGEEPYATDGTNFFWIADIYPGPGSALAQHFTLCNGLLYFAAQTSQSHLTLWRTDGTAFGTQLVFDPVVDNVQFANLTAANGELWFTSNAAGGFEAWHSDGTAAGTARVADLVPGSGGSFPTGFTGLPAGVLFSASDAAGGTDVWIS